MPVYTKPAVRGAWGETNTTSADMFDPGDTAVKTGWVASTTTPPSRQRFNWLLNWLANGIRYFMQRGVPEYDAAETYSIGSVVIAADGFMYRSRIASNIGNATPIGGGTNTQWEQYGWNLSQLDSRYLQLTNVASASVAFATNATNATNAVNATNATNATNANFATSAGVASSASSATAATFASQATTAFNAPNTPFTDNSTLLVNTHSLQAAIPGSPVNGGYVNVLGARVYNTPYFNNSGRVIEVITSVGFSGAGNATAYVDGVAVAVAQDNGNFGVIIPLSFRWPPNTTYQVTAGGAVNYNGWVEL